MFLNADFSKHVVIDTDNLSWEESPMPGVHRRKLDRIGAEVARATSLVKYDPNSFFSEHTHGGGEEFLVLEGVFSDEHADYPAGTYVRNPIGSAHSPHSIDGCTIFVKLHQFDEKDTKQFSIDTRSERFQPTEIPGISILELHKFEEEFCAMIRMDSKTEFGPSHPWVGEEVLVLEGTLYDDAGQYPKGTWIRGPQMSSRHLHSQKGCLLYVKAGHLSGIDRSKFETIS